MNESATIKISAGDSSYFLINGIPHQRGDYVFQPDRYDLINATTLSIINKHTAQFVDDCKFRPISEYINSANIPYANIAQLMLDVAPIAFYSGGSGGGGGGSPQIQSDWTQTNPASLDFIKNKQTVFDIVAQATFTNAHNSGRYVQVLCINSINNEVFLGQVRHPDMNNVEVTFVSPFTGKIILI